jgi:acyl carrier protein
VEGYHGELLYYDIRINSMEKFISIIEDLFQDFDIRLFNIGLKLEEIEGFDSMNAVNLIVMIEANYGVSLEDVILCSDHKISDVMELLKSRGVELS